MFEIEDIDELSAKYATSSAEFIRSSSILALREKKRKMQIERFEILSRYDAATVDELNQKIAKSQAPEHPAWEDLIEIKNIEQEIQEIERDICTLRQA